MNTKTKSLQRVKEPENLRKHQVRRRLHCVDFGQRELIKTCQIRRLSPGKYDLQICFHRRLKTDCNHRRKRGRFTRFHESKHGDFAARQSLVTQLPWSNSRQSLASQCIDVFSTHFSKHALFEARISSCLRMSPCRNLYQTALLTLDHFSETL